MKLSVINQDLALRGQLLQGLLFGFLGWLQQVVDQSSLFIDGLHTVQLYILSLSIPPTEGAGLLFLVLLPHNLFPDSVTLA